MRNFSPLEQNTVAKCLLVTFLAQTAVFARLSVAEPLSEAEMNAFVSSTAVFAVLALAYAWASVDPTVDRTTSLRSIDSPLSSTFRFHYALGVPLGFFCLLYPAGFYELPLKYLSVRTENVPTSNELVMVSMWGGFILGLSLVAGRASCFGGRSRRSFARIMAAQFTGLAVLYVVYWNGMNDVYRFGGLPFFLLVGGLYFYGLVKWVEEPAETKRD